MMAEYFRQEFGIGPRMSRDLPSTHQGEMSHGTPRVNQSKMSHGTPQLAERVRCHCEMHESRESEPQTPYGQSTEHGMGPPPAEENQSEHRIKDELHTLS